MLMERLHDVNKIRELVSRVSGSPREKREIDLHDRPYGAKKRIRPKKLLLSL